ncbi:MAG: monovalent cation/H+ antiporter subunit D [Reyranellaceae bacterium]
MNHWIIVPIVLPALTAAFLVLALRHDLLRQRLVSIASTAALLAVAIALVVLADDGQTRPYAVGDWPAPFGIILVLDRLSAMMLALTAALGLAVAIYASGGWDTRGRHFHALFQFQLMGIGGAFLTGDVFNLFVFFEVMLIASYGLMLHGGGGRRLRAGFQYVAINLIGSTLFLFAVGLIYAVTGTLNMADLAVKAAQVAEGDAALLSAGIFMLLLVFALKAALVPLHWWLPTAYGAASAPVAALFAIMTKVGAYAIIRVHYMVFGDAAAAAAPWIVGGALASMAIGALGALATRRLGDLAAFAVVWSMGSLLVAIGMFEPGAIAAALYYAAHSTIAGAALFLVADAVAQRRPGHGDALVLAPPPTQATPLSIAFFVAAIAMCGLPPLSGFVGKLLILDATRGPLAIWIWGGILLTSLAVIIAFARAGSLLFWKSEVVSVAAEAPAAPAIPALRRTALPLLALLLLPAALAGFAGPAAEYFDAAAAQIADVRGYVDAVLGAGDKGR